MSFLRTRVAFKSVT